MTGVVEQYISALDAKDWEGVGATIADDSFERVGPFCDVIGSKGGYVDFLERVVSALEQYHLRIRRLVGSDNAVYAEVNESFLLDGALADFPEVLVFDLAADGRIQRVQVYMMRPGEEAPVAGARAEGLTRRPA